MECDVWKVKNRGPCDACFQQDYLNCKGQLHLTRHPHLPLRLQCPVLQPSVPVKQSLCKMNPLKTPPREAAAKTSCSACVCDLCPFAH